MGRNSSIKKERRFLESLEGVKQFPKLTLREIKSRPAVLYRFFDNPNYADDFVKGVIRVTTLNECRKYEDPEKGDPGEAIHQLEVKRISSNDLSADDFKSLSARVGINIEGTCNNIVLSNIRRIKKLHDAYVLCTTLEHQPKHFKKGFGQYCVRINKPYLFSRIISYAMFMQTKIEHCQHGKINYRERVIDQSEDEKSFAIGFLKPKDIYEPQKEYRFLWVPNKSPISPLFLSCPNIEGICERIS